jgi:outer membrane protein TolC
MVQARRLGASAEVAQARARLDAARRTLAAYSGETRVVARRNLDVVRETYTLGRATLFDVLNEQRRYLEFEGGYLDALAETFSSQNDLRRALGEGK